MSAIFPKTSNFMYPAADTENEDAIADVHTPPAKTALTVAGRLSLWARSLSDPDAVLLNQAVRGQKDAFDALVRKYEVLLRSFLARRVGPQAADDVLQETLIACWTSLAQYAGRSRFKGWLFGVAAHKCADYHRRRGQVVLQETELSLDLVDERNAYEAVEVREAVQDVLRRLPDAQREVIELYYYAELTLAEIAVALGRNLNTVKYQFYRAHAIAAGELKSSDIGPP